MKIAVIGQQFLDSLAHNYAYTLGKMGHQVYCVDEQDVRFVAHLRRRFPRIFGVLSQHPQFEPWRSRQIVKLVDAFQPDFVINTFRDLHPAAVKILRDACPASTRIVFRYPDAIANLGRMLPLAADYDAWFFKDRSAVEMFRSKLKLEAHYLPESFNPDWHMPVTLTEQEMRMFGCDLTLAGNMYYYRARLVEPLVKYDIKIWGHFARWIDSPLKGNYQRHYVAGVEKAKAFRAAKIVVNTLHPTEMSSVNVRTFEAAGCGAFQIVEWRPAVDELFLADTEIVSFRSQDELIDKVDFYLKHPELRRRIANAGMRRANLEYTYAHRLSTMLSLIE